jgi:hypothetical protein
MKRPSKWMLVPVVAMTLSILAGWGAPNKGITTIGEFALKVSRALGQRPADQPTAVRALRKAGVDLGKDLDASLTWGQAAKILRDLGVRVTDPKEPAGQISQAKADQIATAVGLIRGEFSRASVEDAKKKDCPVSPSDPEDCDDDDDDQGDDGD